METISKHAALGDCAIALAYLQPGNSLLVKTNTALHFDARCVNPEVHNIFSFQCSVVAIRILPKKLNTCV